MRSLCQSEMPDEKIPSPPGVSVDTRPFAFLFPHRITPACYSRGYLLCRSSYLCDGLGAIHLVEFRIVGADNEHKRKSVISHNGSVEYENASSGIAVDDSSSHVLREIISKKIAS